MEQVKTPDLTVITVCYNAASDLEMTLRSVTGQSARKRMEIIVIDGGSTDKTPEVLDRYRDRIDRIVSEPDKGIYNAMNKGIGLSTGRYVNFMNAGDRFFDGQTVADFLTEIEKMEERPDIVYGWTVMKYPEGCRPRRPALYAMPREIGCCHQSILVDGDLLRREPFDESYRIVADYELFHRLYRKGARFAEIDKYIAVYDMTGISSDPATERLRYSERCRVNGVADTTLGFNIKRLRIKFGEKRRAVVAALRQLAGMRISEYKLRPIEEFKQFHD